jgi:tRNA threonylcarbamoyladenosine biosynthesis protein TsaB
VRLLAVDTCFGACSAAVLAGSQVLAGRREVMPRGHAEALAPMVEEVMRAAGLSFADLDKLAVTTGPGSFTGQRVGLAFMRGMRVALVKPLVGITSLSAMAQQARAETDCAIGAAVHDAKRDEVYLEMVGHAVPAQIMTVAEAARLLSPFSSLALAGTAAPLLAQHCPNAIITTITAPDAAWVGLLALPVEAVGAPRPLYLRPPDAKLPAAKP